MHISNPLTTLLPLYLAATVSAAPLAGRDVSASTGSWQVSGLSIGCSPAGCAYDFVITGEETSNTPAFNTTCQGSDLANEYQACVNSAISANLIPHGDPIWEVQVRHQWPVNSDASDAGFSEQFGNTNFTDGTAQFTVPITSEDGIS
jgi:hypothetical protein